MSVMLNIQDETTSGKLLSKCVVEFPIECITVKQLIEARVSQEVERYNLSRNGEFNGFIQPTESEQLLNGYKLAKGQSIATEKQKKAALKAFQSNGFFLLVNDTQISDLDDEIVITPDTVVVFLKLVPLVGG